ncbi:MAG: hypothetical protein KDA74_19855, partial [Planctomycetaceae bacterium]|nr:hypothetical protein [Planctomycetaceae bacterium]
MGSGTKIDGNDGDVTITAFVNIELGLVTTSANANLTTIIGAISDANGGSNNIDATNVSLLAGAGIGLGDALETTISAVAGDSGSGGLFLANTGTLDIGYGGSVLDLTVGDASTITSTGTISVKEYLLAFGNSGTIRVESTGGNVEMDPLTEIYGGDGDLEVIADGNVELGLLTTTANVTVEATNGAISDANGDPANNINATNVTLTAATGAGVGDALETTISALEANTGSGGLFLDNTGTLDIGYVGGTLTGVMVGGASRIESDGTMTVKENITASGGNLDLENTSGNFVLDSGVTISNGAFKVWIESDNDLTVNGTVQTVGEEIRLRADNDLILGANSLVDTTSAASVFLTANYDGIGGGAFTQTDGGTSLVDAQGGNLNVDAEGDVKITNLQSAGGSVTIFTYDGSILDNTSLSEAPLVVADEL